MQPSGIYHPACSCAPSSSLVCAQSAACGAHTQPLSCPSSSPCQLMDGSQLALARLVSGRALADVRGPRHCRCVHFCLAPHRASSPGRRCNPVCVCVCACVCVRCPWQSCCCSRPRASYCVHARARRYILRMERIPRPGSRDVVFFMHGVLDTSMAWVSAGEAIVGCWAAWGWGA